jgi:hypothetical protein
MYWETARTRLLHFPAYSYLAAHHRLAAFPALASPRATQFDLLMGFGVASLRSSDGECIPCSIRTLPGQRTSSLQAISDEMLLLTPAGISRTQ